MGSIPTPSTKKLIVDAETTKLERFIMKKTIFTIVAVLSTSVCFAENKFDHLFKSFAYVDTTPCQTINRFYRERCEVVAGNSESVERSEVVGDGFGESISQNESRRVYLERLNLENVVHTPAKKGQ